MEALGVVASVVAVVQISTQIITTSTAYIQRIQDAPTDLKHLLVEISTLKGLFESLKVLVGCDPNTSALDAQLAAPVEGCLAAVVQLDNLLGRGPSGGHRDEDEPVTNTHRGKRRKLTSAVSRLAWPLKQNQAKRLLSFISAYKGTITLALSTCGMYDTPSVISSRHNLRG
jgi:hypothetical protein